MINYAKRVETVRQRLRRSEFDGLLMADVNNCRYLTGFANDHGGVAYVLLTADVLYLITDYRYAEQAQAECVDTQVVVRDRANVSLPEQFKRLALDSEIKHLGFEREKFNYGLICDIQSAMTGVELSGYSGWVEQQRMVKDEHEIACMRRAAAIADGALAELGNVMKAGLTERRVALELEYLMQAAGSQGLAFDTIMLSGERSALPHGTPSERKLTRGDLITIDFGAVVDGYRSDMTREFVVGQPDDKQMAVYESVRAAQQAAIDKISAGVCSSEPSLAAKQILDDTPFAQYQGEGLGHGVGLLLHEQPFMSVDCDIVLEKNMIVTVEPGIYIPGWGGVRVEDDMLVTEKGCEYITHAPRDLIVISR